MNTETIVNGAAAPIAQTIIAAAAEQASDVVLHTAPPPNAIAPAGRFDLSPTSFDEAVKLAEYLANSSMVPKDYQGNPGNVLVAIQWGLELGLKPLQAMQNIAVINGRPSLWGDAVLALVLASPVCVDVIERYEGTGLQKRAVCIARRRGKEDKVGEFSMEDAERAGLIGKAGPWKQYPDRMLKMRARAFALRDQFTDVLKGIAIAEEQQDIAPDGGPDGRLNGGSSRPAIPAGAKGSEIAKAQRPQLSEEGAAVIVTLTRIAKTEGYAKLKAEWQKLTPAMREEIGTDKRDEMVKMGHEFDEKRKGAATDVESTDVTPA